MRISVCMGVYNGEKYIKEQLESIRLQTRQPDEVILCDDRSTDTTCLVVDEYLTEHSELTGWSLSLHYRSVQRCMPVPLHLHAHPAFHTSVLSCACPRCHPDR